jgi:anti-sigma factor RsiW
MNPTHESLPNVPPEQLDLLVDGELPERDRRELLRTLEQTPGGWRACALAFLESQWWKKDITAFARSAETEPDAAERLATTPAAAQSSAQTAASPPAVAVRRPWPGRRMLWLHWGEVALAMAASFLLALAVGPWIRDTGTPTEGPSAGMRLAGSSGITGQPRGVAGENAPLRVVTMPVPNDPKRRVVELPVIEREQMDESMLRPDASAFPPEFRAAMRRRGYQVQQERQLLPFSMEDGRRLVVPVDQVELRYIGNPSYQ